MLLFELKLSISIKMFLNFILQINLMDVKANRTINIVINFNHTIFILLRY